MVTMLAQRPPNPQPPPRSEGRRREGAVSQKGGGQYSCWGSGSRRVDVEARPRRACMNRPPGLPGLPECPHGPNKSDNMDGKGPPLAQAGPATPSTSDPTVAFQLASEGPRHRGNITHLLLCGTGAVNFRPPVSPRQRPGSPGPAGPSRIPMRLRRPLTQAREALGGALVVWPLTPYLI